MNSAEFDMEEIRHMSTSDTKDNNQMKVDCFPCPHCDRAFPLKQLLDLHVANHNRDRDFECGECNRKFFTKVSYHLLRF